MFQVWGGGVGLDERSLTLAGLCSAGSGKELPESKARRLTLQRCPFSERLEALCTRKTLSPKTSQPDN